MSLPITTHALIVFDTWRPIDAEFSASAETMTPVNVVEPFGNYSTPAGFFGSLIDNTPISEPQFSFFGRRGPSFLDDYYFRIHIIPGQLVLGNLLSAQIRNVEVWNSYLDPNLLSSVGQVGTDGITLQQPQTPPTFFAALEARTYTLSINTNGPPVIDATYSFNFQTEQPTLKVTGRRVVLWPFIPETGHDETMEWKTDILPSYKNEQRLALRQAPRQAFRHSFLLDPEQFSRAKAISTQWAHRVYGIPAWAEVSLLEGGLTAGTTFIPFDTSFADYRNDDLILLWSSDKRLIALEITTVTPSGVNLKLPLEENWPECYVAPLRFARTLSGVEYSRTSNEYVVASAAFDVTQNIDLGTDAGFPAYRGKPVMIDRSAVVGDLRERIARTVDVFDNGSGPLLIDTQTDWVRNLQTLSFSKRTRQDIWNLRRWIHARRGRQRGFWMPSWNKDLVILEDVGPTGSALTIRPIGYPLYYGIKDIMIQLRNGTRLFVRATSGATNPEGNEVLALSGQVGTGFTAANVEFACFMTHCRFDSDRVTFRHGDAGRVTVSIPIAETPEQ